MAEPITLDQIKRFVAAWFRVLDQHDPVENVLALLADHDLMIMIMPDQPMRDHDAIRQWYGIVTRMFFDETHYVNGVAAEISGDGANVRVEVGWQASAWEAPAAKSKRISMGAISAWTVRRSTKNAYGLELVTQYGAIEPVKFAAGFASL
jgi:hypothetical protein